MERRCYFCNARSTGYTGQLIEVCASHRGLSVTDKGWIFWRGTVWRSLHELEAHRELASQEKITR